MLGRIVIVLATIACLGASSNSTDAMGSEGDTHSLAARAARDRFVGHGVSLRDHGGYRPGGDAWLYGFPGRYPGNAYRWGDHCPLWSAYYSAFNCWTQPRSLKSR